MKKRVKLLLQKKNVYYKLKYSFLFRIYLHIFKAGEIKKERKEIAFYQSFLSPCNLVFDIGANDGHKTEAFLKISKKIVCCEPDKTNFHVLQTRFRHKRKRVFLENSAVSDIAGKSAFYIHHSGSAFNTLSLKWKETLEKDNIEKWSEKIKFSGKDIVDTTTLDLLIKKYGEPDFIKIDVEGHETNVLKGLTKMVSVISFEALLPDGFDELYNCLQTIKLLNPNAIYNIAIDEKLILPHFISYNKLVIWLKENDPMHLEIIVKKD